jgi:hypothetical protein
MVKQIFFITSGFTIVYLSVHSSGYLDVCFGCKSIGSGSNVNISIADGPYTI